LALSTGIDHVTITSTVFQASRDFYDLVMSAAGLASNVDHVDPEQDERDADSVAALGYGDPVRVLLVAGRVPTTGAHVALRVSGRRQVQQAYQAAVGADLRVVQAPREWEAAQLGYYGIQIADPAGNLIEILSR